MIDEVTKLMYIMRQYFSPNIFDNQVYNIVYLPKEEDFIGPIYYRQIYYLEQYIKIIRYWIKKIIKIEELIAKDYVLYERMQYLIKYTTRLSLQVKQL